MEYYLRIQAVNNPQKSCFGNSFSVSLGIEIKTKVMTEEQLQALLDQEDTYINEWRESLTQQQIDTI